LRVTVDEEYVKVLRLRDVGGDVACQSGLSNTSLIIEKAKAAEGWHSMRLPKA
jgi:hypothetical protein